MKNLEKSTNHLQTAEETVMQISVNGIKFDEAFIAELLANYLRNKPTINEPTVSTAFQIYMRERTGRKGQRFVADATRNCNYFISQFGDMPLRDLRHMHGAQFRDAQLAKGLNPVSVRKQFATLNAMLNVSFKYLDIDRLSPFRGLYIEGEGETKRYMRTITPELLQQVKAMLLKSRTQYKLVALLQLNTGFRLSEPMFALRKDLVLDHEIPHLWIRRNELSDRKTKSSIRAVPLVGASYDAAVELNNISKWYDSPWLVPQYARENGNASCSAIINKYLKDLEFRSHMFRHALVDRLKACNDVPTRLAESITGHSSGGSDFNIYGTVGYTLEQKLEVLRRVEV
jgi:integrase